MDDYGYQVIEDPSLGVRLVIDCVGTHVQSLQRELDHGVQLSAREGSEVEPL